MTRLVLERRWMPSGSEVGAGGLVEDLLHTGVAAGAAVAVGVALAGVIARVQGGEVELETIDGTWQRFGVGAVPCLAGLPLRVLRSPGPGPATLAAIRRNRTDSFSAQAPSYSC